MSTLCRTCGEPIYNVNPRNLFKRENEDIRRNIEALTGIKLSYDSHLPSHICSCCYLDLEHSISFRSRCLETHAQLMNVKHEASSVSQVFSTKFEQFDPLDDINQNHAEEDIINEHQKFDDCPQNSKLSLPKKDKPSVKEGPTKHYLSSKDSSKLSRVTILDKKTLPVVPSRPVDDQKAASRRLLVEGRKPKQKIRRSYLELEKNYVCDVCGWSFRDVSNLKSHALRHTGEKKFACKECDRKFFDKSQYMLHIRVRHRGEKPFVCKYCGLSFANSPARCRHERKFHANQLPFECDLCSRTFISQVSLNSHKLVHVNGEKIHHCDTCNKTFKDAGILKTHLTTRYHQKRLNRLVKEEYKDDQDDDQDYDRIEMKVINDEDMEFEFYNSDSIIEEIDE